MATGLIDIIAILLASTIPCLIYLIWVRQTETCRREPYSSVVRVFILGATFSIGVAFVIETLIIALFLSDGAVLEQYFWGLDDLSEEAQLFILAVIVAPIVEESTKVMGIFFSYRRLTEVENGIVYGAAVGLGFAATENMLYLGDAMVMSVAVFVTTAVARAISSTLIHASASGVAGYGIARFRLSRSEGLDVNWICYLGLAILMHAVFNFFAILGVIYSSGGDDAYFVGVLISVLLAITAFRILRHKIRDLDTESVC